MTGITITPPIADYSVPGGSTWTNTAWENNAQGALSGTVNEFVDYINGISIGGATPLSSIAALRLTTGSGSVYAVEGWHASTAIGGGTFFYDASDSTSADDGGTVIVNASGSRYKRVGANSRVTVEMFGAYGDGATDDTAACQDAAAALAVKGGGILAFGSTQYKITDTITLSSNFDVDMGGAILDLSSASSGTKAFIAAGSFATGIPIDVDAAPGDTALTCSGVTGIAAGDWIQIYSETVFDPGWSNGKFAEFVKVLSVSGSTVNLATKLIGGTYLVSDTASIRKATFVENVRIRGGRCIGSSTATVFHSLCSMTLVHNCRIENIHHRYLNDAAVVLTNCIGAVVTKIHVEDALSSSSGYGVDIVSACQDCTVSDSVFIRVRHAVTNATAAADTHGVARRITYANLHVFNTINNGDGFDTHGNAEDLIFANCTSFGAFNGFNCECRSVRYVGCKSINATHYGFAISIGATVFPASMAIVGCDVINPGVYGISIQGGSTINSSTTESVLVNSCHVSGSPFASILVIGQSGAMTVKGLDISSCHLAGATAAHDSLIVGPYVENARIIGNYVAVNDVAVSGLNISAKYAVVALNEFEYTVSSPNGGSSSACIRLNSASGTGCDEIQITGNIGRQTTSAGGYGVRISGAGTATRISVDKSNDFSDCTNPNTVKLALAVSASALTIPYQSDLVIDVTNSGNITDIIGGKAGQRLVLLSSAASGAVVKTNAGSGTTTIHTPVDFTFSGSRQTIALIHTGLYWIGLGSSLNI